MEDATPGGTGLVKAASLLQKAARHRVVMLVLGSPSASR